MLPARIFAMGGLAVLLGVVSFISIAGPVPSILSPHSMAVVIPYLLHGPVLAMATCPVLFLATGAGLPFAAERMSRAPVWTFAALATASIAWLASGIAPGIEHYGTGHTVGLLSVNGLAVMLLAGVLPRVRKRPAFGAQLLFHWLVWAWVAWGAFGWLRHFP